VLRKPSLRRRTRLVLLQCGQLGDTSGSYIDAIGLHYMLNPYFFSAHFELCRQLNKAGSIIQSHAPALLPPERHFLQIVPDSNSHMTATWKISGNECTSKLLSDPSPIPLADLSQSSHLDWIISGLIDSPSCVMNY
jgi:hypothetical protein